MVKRCPTCNRTYDQNLSFCLDDGTPLVKVDTAAYDSAPTIASPSPQGHSGFSEPAPQQSREDTAGDWQVPAYQAPGLASPGAAGKRRVWPWVVSLLALLLLVTIAVGVVAAIYLPDMMRASGNNNDNGSGLNSNTNGGNDNSSRHSNANANSAVTNTNSNTNANVNSNVNANLNGNANANSNANSLAGELPPTDREAVLSDLTHLENDWTVANINADKKALRRILADDYVSTALDGSMHGKADYLRDIKPDPTVRNWSLSKLQLTFKGDRATLEGAIRLEHYQSKDETLNFIDKFVWRDKRWQAVGSEVTPVE